MQPSACTGGHAGYCTDIAVSSRHVRPPIEQVIELGALLHSGRVWQEVGLMRGATPPRIVKLLGVGIEVGCAL